MTERYLFRGKREEKREWVVGHYVFLPAAVQCDGFCGEHRIYVPPKDPDDDFRFYRIDYRTTGQCTGLLDKNGALIFESDIADDGYRENSLRGIVKWYEGSFWLWPFDDTEPPELLGNIFDDLEIIGNIHDNPELITSGT